MFLGIYMLGSTQLGQLLKLPELIQHYAEHKKTNPSLNFLGFLHIHYAHAFEMDEDFEEDMKLPFKTADSGNSAVSIFTPASSPDVSGKRFTDLKNTFAQKNDPSLSSQYLSAIWQPPRTC